ncbi:ribonuclease J [Roseomonas chloroacetimidivorans]|jgi:ribonuclease J|uniref:ribonuclease J n=1 Tax=Roseomonas chloroacetimidivorans TaxID=1766656 RepID=UPI003C762C89
MTFDATDDLAFLPLGGTGEIGMNLNVYRLDGQLLAVDCGIGFGGAESPEAEILVPDPAWLTERRDRLVGLVITHAHEDHLGAVAALWPFLRCPVYASPFASAVLRRKLGEAGLLNEVTLHTVPLSSRMKVGNFDLQFLRVAHSVPEAQALAIRTRHGIVLHTGDWKLDPNPLTGPPTDEAGFAALGEEGVLAMVCDSTNALVDGHSGSEADVREALTSLIAGLKGRVAVACFATNIARVESISRAAMAAGRRVALFGRSLRNADAAARETGYLTDLPPFLDEEEAGYLPDDELLIICTGSQGEPRSALAKIAADTHPQISLGEGDTVIFSSRMIPGNEKAIMNVEAALYRAGCRVITPDSEHPVHVSGHPAKDELRRLYELVKPRHAVPVHGEWRHLQEHAALAREFGSEPHLIEDGDVLCLGPGPVEVCETVQSGKLALDGTRLLPLEGGVLGARRRMLFNGVVVGSLAVDDAGRVRGIPQISAPGLFEQGEDAPAQIAADLARLVNDLPAPLRREDAALREAARAALRKAIGRRVRKRPLVELHLLRV